MCWGGGIFWGNKRGLGEMFRSRRKEDEIFFTPIPVGRRCPLGCFLILAVATVSIIITICWEWLVIDLNCSSCNGRVPVINFFIITTTIKSL